MNLRIACLPSSVQNTESSGPMKMPCVRLLKRPPPNERRKFPPRSKTITGWSVLRVRANTSSRELTATPGVSTRLTPTGSFGQSTIGS